MSKATEQQAIATEILRQLGGNRFRVMTGSYDLYASKQCLVMKLKKNKSKSNYLKIKLTAMDDYSMMFYKIGNSTEMELLHEETGVYCEQLQSIFTDVTGFYTSI